MRVAGFGQVLFGLSIAAIGAFGIGWHSFAEVPKWLGPHHTVAAIFGVILLAGGLALLVPRTAKAASLVLAAVLVLRFLLLRIPPLAAHPLVEGVYEEMSETLFCIAGAWTIFSMLAREGGILSKFGNIRAGQIVFALATPGIGLSHFFYLNLTAPLIPSWLPFHVPLAYFTGAAWIAAGLGIFFGVLPRLAATLTAVMVSLFTLLVWVPMIVGAPAKVSNWSEILTSAAITGAAWAVAESFRGRSWVLSRSG